MNKIIKPIERLRGTLSVPGDKSISHRSLILGSLCEGDVDIDNLSTAEDCRSTRLCLSQLGIEFSDINGRTIVHGRGLHGFTEADNIVDCGNSGTTMRLLSGLAAAQPFYTILTGDDSLRRRPMKRILAPLGQMGARILARDNNSKPPLAIAGQKLQAVRYEMPVSSAQVKSAILIAGLYCSGSTTVIEGIPSRDHTERMLQYFGADINTDNNSITVKPGRLEPGKIFVPGDISSAIYYIIGGLLVPNSEMIIKRVGLNRTRTGCLDALIRMGAEIEITESGHHNNEPHGDIHVRSSSLRAIEIGPEMIPSLVDEVPILALAATQAEGTTVISGATELRYKESDRLHGIASQLKLMEASIEERPDGLIIKGGATLKGASVDSFDDHRLAMTLSIAGLIAEDETTVKNAESVMISLPEFYDLLQQLENNGHDR